MLINKFAGLFIKDAEMQRSLIMLIVVFGIFIFLWNARQEKLRDVRYLQGKKNLIMQSQQLRNESQKSGPLRGLVLTGIMSGDKEATAIINNTFVRAGDKVAPNVTVVEIKSNSVVLTNGKGYFQIRINE